MSDADKQDPNSTSDDLDLKSFYRGAADPIPQSADSNDNDLDLKNFYRNSPDTAQQGISASADNLDIRDFYLPPGAEPRVIPQSATGDVPTGRVSPYALKQEQVADAEKPGESLAEPGALAAESDTQAQPLALAPGPVEKGTEAPASAIRNPLYRFVGIGALGGLMFGVILIFFSWLVSNPSGPYDLGLVTSDAFGLKGHLFTKWEQKSLQYRISFEPNAPEQGAGFALALSNPPRPLSIAFQLKDAKGFVLCTKDVLIKYDPSLALPPLPAAPAIAKGKKDAPSQAELESARQADLLQLQTQEAQREKGQDIFQEQTGSNGQVAAISSQGEIPCSNNSYEKVAMWSFSADFPSVAEQADLVRQRAAGQADAERAANSRRRQPPKPAAKPLSFAIEGDDVLVGYDPTPGVLETGTGQSFYVDKQANLSAWEAFPLRIHYRCDEATGCTLIRAGSGTALHARLRR